MEELIRQGKKAAASRPKRRTEIVLPKIDPRFEHIKKSYDVHALSMRCNANKCKKKPSKRVLISETIVRNKKERELAMLYVCNDHSKSINKLEKDLNALTKGGMVSVVMSEKK